MKRIVLIFALIALTGIQSAKADEGMWMINMITEALEKKMQERGLELSAGEIYNADAPGTSLADAVVSLDFGCTGSIISDKGLLITNHHCAYSDIHALSTPECNYLEEGFWAFEAEEEKVIPGKNVFFFKKVIDVTEEVEALKSDLEAQGIATGIRKISHLMEKEYNKKTGYEAWLASMWSGSKYYIALYDVYSDVRLVAAPPVSSAAFGGDIDNWEWPQHKCDFAMYRVYTAPDGSPAEYSPSNIPMKPEKKLNISLEGYKEGDFTMIIGYPGRINRYSSSYEVDFNEALKLPITNRIRGEQMSIIKAWMDADPQVRLKYADYYFSLSNIQELESGEVECFGRFDVVEKKAELEKELQEWIMASAERAERWGDLLSNTERNYNALREPERNATFYRETIVRGTRLGTIIRRLFNTRNLETVDKRTLREYSEIDLRVEKDLMTYAIKEYISNVDPVYLSAWQKDLVATYSKDGVCDLDAMANGLWESSIFGSAGQIEKIFCGKISQEQILADPLGRFIMDVKITLFNDIKLAAENGVSTLDLNREYTRALYQMYQDKGIEQYPDANSTMRITYGTVGGLEPREGVVCDWKTTPEELLEKFNPADYDFHLNDRQYLLYRAKQWGRWGFGEDGSQMYVDFLTDNDITGGNSGSPVLNSRGELIGLAFDGNKESLASDAMYVPGYNKCVCVDIRFILWTLDRYAGMTRIIEELGL